MPPIEHTPVLVAGAGPAGLAAAIELSRHGVPVLLVERRTRPSSHPRATVLSLRSTELVRAWGLETRVRGHSVDVDPRMLLADTLADAAAGSVVAVGYPTREQSRVLSPVEVLCVAQDDLEAVLLGHLLRRPDVQVVLGHEVAGVSVEADGALVALRETRTGAEREVHAGHVIAADGARSSIRGALGIAMRGEEDVMTGFTTLLHAPLWDVVGAHRHLLYGVAKGTFLPAGGDRWLFGATDDEDRHPHAELVREAAGVDDLPVHVERSRAFTAATQVAETFRAGPVLLSGDAAHRVTPRGGTGLNLALHDGFDLGWKLAWLHHGWAGDDLLDTYEAERRPVVEGAVARSADPGGSRREPLDGVVADLGGRIPHVWTGGRSTIDLVGTGLTLFTGPEGDVRAPLPDGIPAEVHRLDPVAASAVGVTDASGVLVRPDGRRLEALVPALA